MLVEPGKTYVRRLRAAGDGRDALALRLRLERALSGADLHPKGLPADAILCVRRLSDRRARALLASGRAGLAASDWERAVSDALERLARSAARPARGAVPANAEAVIFRDQAELLACLAADWSGGAAPARWWWQSLFGGDAARAMPSAWLAAPEHVPTALGRLAEAGQLLRVVRALGEDGARAVRRQVAVRFGLSELHAALEAPPAREATDGARVESRGGKENSFAAPRPAPTERTGAPWERYAPELRGQGLGEEQSRLVGVGLMLLRAPSRVRAASFAELVRDWRNGEGAPTAWAVEASEEFSVPGLETKPRAGDEGRAADTHAAARSLAAPDSAGATARAAGTDLEESTVQVRPLSPDLPPSRASERKKDDGRRFADEATVNQVLTQKLPDKGGAEGDARRGGPASGLSAVAPAAEEFVAPEFVGEARIRTEFGGLFYLINLGLFLNLYGDFTAPLSPGLALPIWDFVALVGRRLAGKSVTGDPVWPLLANLSGRGPDEPPGREFAPADEWRVPPEWLAPFREAGAWEWSDEGERLRVRHPAGFLVLDVAHEGDAEKVLARESEAYAEVACFTLRRGRAAAEDEGDAGGAVGRWLGRLAPYVSARLCRALGVADADAAGQLVCQQPARVSVTETRLDVTFKLARLPIEVRLSGLDRDPGWVPAAGRRVAFHYE